MRGRRTLSWNMQGRSRPRSTCLFNAISACSTASGLKRSRRPDGHLLILEECPRMAGEHYSREFKEEAVKLVENGQMENFVHAQGLPLYSTALIRCMKVTMNLPAPEANDEPNTLCVSTECARSAFKSHRSNEKFR